MTKDTPYWYKLISYWVKNKKREGLTIPFIIGAEKHANPDVTKTKSVAELITDIINTDIDDTITLFYCDTIGEYVLGINNRFCSMQGHEIQSETTNKTTLIATSSMQILGKNINEIVSSLTKKYAQSLSDKKYSYDKGNWTTYSDIEMQMINESLYAKN